MNKKGIRLAVLFVSAFLFIVMGCDFGYATKEEMKRAVEKYNSINNTDLYIKEERVCSVCICYYGQGDLPEKSKTLKDFAAFLKNNGIKTDFKTEIQCALERNENGGFVSDYTKLSLPVVKSDTALKELAEEKYELYAVQRCLPGTSASTVKKVLKAYPELRFTANYLGEEIDTENFLLLSETGDISYGCFYELLKKSGYPLKDEAFTFIGADNAVYDMSLAYNDYELNGKYMYYYIRNGEKIPGFTGLSKETVKTMTGIEIRNH